MTRSFPGSLQPDGYRNRREWAAEKNAGPVSRERPARAVRPRFGSAVCTGCMSSVVPCSCCSDCGEHHPDKACQYLATCAECSRHGEEMHADRLCVDCHESEQRAAELDRRDEYAGLSRRDAEYYDRGENWRGE
jgi:hypothetical protein